MGTARSTISKTLPDILVLHGLSRHLVDHVVTLCGSLGLQAASVLDLPSLGKRQFDKVRYYIRSSSIRIVIASFDERQRKSLRARPNLYDELGQCAGRPEQTIVLREKRGGERVEIPSNIEGQLVVIEFDQDVLYELAAPLIRELRSLLPVRRPAEIKFAISRKLKEFMSKMDRLWDNELDPAWEKIYRQDYEAEREFAIVLDRFFQRYHGAFAAIVSAPPQSDKIEQILNEHYHAACTQTVRAWEIIAEGKMRLADGMRRNGGTILVGQPAYDRGHTELRRGKNASESAGNAIEHFKTAIKYLDRYTRKGRR